MMGSGGGQKMRLFTGISLNPEVREYVAGVVRVLSSEVSDVRWVPFENSHVTLKFLGACDPDRLDKLIAAMKNAAVQLPLTLNIGGVGAFPSLASARVIWVGAEDIEGHVHKVYNVLEKGAEKCGIPREKRRYTPHITIGRARKKPVNLPRELAERFEEELLLEVEEILLFESRLSSTGAEYKIIQRVGPQRLRA